MIDPVSGERLSDQRLCWLAVRDELWRRPPNRIARTGFGEVQSLVARIVTRIYRPYRYRELHSDRMADLALIVDDLSTRLAAQERDVLRRTGRVPDWFVSSVRDAYEQGDH
jgi:hypothetical protein